MNFRIAQVKDIDNYMIVRMAVKENVLSNPAKVTRQDNIDYITKNGKGWVCEIENTIVGFAIVGLVKNNVWALFVHPDFEKKGIGRKLHDLVLDWYFKQTKEKIWLETDRNSYAETFYKKIGWVEVNNAGSDEVKFEITYDYWVDTKKL
jgi:GNAT superfamily N-acetyltransferase